MPELPEVESIRRSLAARLVGRRVRGVAVHRRDVTALADAARPPTPRELLRGRRIAAVTRHGKQLALVSDDGRAVCIQLGMSGRVSVCDVLPAPAIDEDPAAHTPAWPPHTHVVWALEGGWLAFTDPRRFGGVTACPTLDALRDRWAALGPDALAIGPATLHGRLLRTRRALKAALLDQGLVAGLGNIYVDELLFGAGLSPFRPADTLCREDAASLVRRMRTLLARAVEAGGSSIRDYRQADGAAGGFQRAHRVYGRQGKPCRRRGCEAVVRPGVVAGRTTAWCPACQPGTDHYMKEE